MPTILAVKIPINADRYLPGVGVQIYPVGTIEVGVGQRRLNRNGLNIDANNVATEIGRLLRAWEGKTLVEVGTKPPKNLKKPPVFVPFYPSSENIAAYVYTLFFSYPLRFKTNLAFVRVINTFLNATYYQANFPGIPST